MVIGRKGKRVHPPQFQFPTSVAADRLGNIYVADYGNARIQILDVKGHVIREPLNMGGKCKPCALAVSLRGDLVITDAQILRVFSKTGKCIPAKSSRNRQYRKGKKKQNLNYRRNDYYSSLLFHPAFFVIQRGVKIQLIPTVYLLFF